MVHFHEVLAHEGANPIAFTGRFVGRPDLAGIGAHIQRYFLEQPGGQRAVPYLVPAVPHRSGLPGDLRERGDGDRVSPRLLPAPDGAASGQLGAVAAARAPRPR